MEFMLVCYQNERRWDEMPAALQEKIRAECDAYVEEVRRSGRLRSGGRLQPSATARTVRHAAGRELITDGPFAETKEVFAGFMIVDCRDREEAVALSTQNPRLRYGLGSVEVRPVIPEYSMAGGTVPAEAR